MHCSLPGLFPQRYWEAVEPSEVQTALRQIFAQWGLPERIRVDNGSPWGTTSDLPHALALWLLGLGIDLLWNRPGRPQENGKVERVHGLVDQWGEPDQCPTFAHWVARLDWLVRLQRERYPACDGRSRLAAYPALTSIKRPFDPAAEALTWDFERVKRFLAARRWSRRVCKVGRITFAHRVYAVGRPFKRRQVWVALDPELLMWLVFDEVGQILARHPAPELTPARMRELKVGVRYDHQDSLVPHPAPA